MNRRHHIPNQHRSHDPSVEHVVPAQITFQRLTVSTWVSRTKIAGSYREEEEERPPRPSLHQRVRPAKVKKVLLRNVTGTFDPGQLSVILGPSGAGKTVFLNTLSGQLRRTENMQFQGEILVNQEPIPGGRSMNLISGYVEQNDVILESMTVEEAIKMSLLLRAPELNVSQRKQALDRVVNLLQLQKARTTMVGSVLKKGISGGEKKRTSIAMELVANPSILFADEPTSGLDTYTQLTVVRLLHTIAHQHGRTVVATIHNPASEMLTLFDRMIFLVDGRIMYQGPPSELIAYFSSLGYSFPRYRMNIPNCGAAIAAFYRHANPTDVVFLEITHSLGNEESPEEQRFRVQTLCDYYDISLLFQWILANMERGPRTGITRTMLKRQSSVLRQQAFLFRREFLFQIRNVRLLAARIFGTVFLSVFISLVYLNVYSSSSPPGAIIQNVSGALFFVIINQLFTSMNSVLTSFGTGRAAFLKEYGSGYYSLTPFFLSKVLVEIPFAIISPVLVALITYWIIGFRMGFLWYLLFLILTSLCGAALGFFASSLFENVALSVILAPLLLLPLIVYGGFFVNNFNSPEWLAWLQWISPAQYAFTGLMRAELEGETFQGFPGNAQLDLIGARGRFEPGINVVFLVAIFVTVLGMAFLALAWLLRRIGHSRSDLNKIRKEIEKRT